MTKVRSHVLEIQEYLSPQGVHSNAVLGLEMKQETIGEASLTMELYDMPFEI